VTPDYQADEVTLYHGDCRAVLPTLPGASFDLVFTDPPYPEIDRPYGRLTEAQWFDLMRAVVPEVRRVLKPKGSAVFVLQPNSERVGRMRTWLWDFLAWVGREWGIVQDAWWRNHNAMPCGGSNTHGLLRASLKACVWCGPPDCYRDQGKVLVPPNRRTPDRTRLQERKRELRSYPGGIAKDGLKILAASAQRGGATPFNVITVGGGSPPERRERRGHPAGTPIALCDWWLRYLCPPGGAVLDPFAGSGTTGVAALRQGKTFVGIEKESAYIDIARKRLAEVHGPLFAPREVTADG
jgi:DNA modification methylase